MSVRLRGDRWHNLPRSAGWLRTQNLSRWHGACHSVDGEGGRQGITCQPRSTAGTTAACPTHRSGSGHHVPEAGRGSDPVVGIGGAAASEDGSDRPSPAASLTTPQPAAGQQGVGRVSASRLLPQDASRSWITKIEEAADRGASSRSPPAEGYRNHHRAAQGPVHNRAMRVSNVRSGPC